MEASKSWVETKALFINNDGDELLETFFFDANSVTSFSVDANDRNRSIVYFGGAKATIFMAISELKKIMDAYSY